METPPDVPDWDVVGKLYDALEIVERTRPGSIDARNLEDAIDLVLDGRTGNRNVDFLVQDAVRRAEFLRQQANRKRPTAVASRRLPDRAVVQTADDALDGEVVERVDPVTPADIVCARDTARAIATAAAAGPRGRLVEPVLAGLLADHTATALASELVVSRSTIDRTIRAIRTHAHGVLAVQEAA